MESEENREQRTKVNQDTTLSLSKIERIALLQNTIDQLETVVEGLSADSAIDLPLDDSINTLVATTEKLSSAVANPAKPEASEPPPPSTTPVDTATTISPQTPPKTVAETPQQKAFAAKTARPVNQTARKNQRVLIGVIAAVAIALIAVLLFWLPQRSSSLQPQGEVSQTKQPETEIVVSGDRVTAETETTEETSTKSIEVTPAEPRNADLEPETIEPETILSVDIPAELIAPGKSQNLKVKTIESKIQLTPEQNLIAAIQTRVREITQDYAGDLVVSAEADLVNSNLSVQVSDFWYELDSLGQSELANEMLQQSRRLNFQKLAIKDSKNNLVARSPVVGETAIILSDY